MTNTSTPKVHTADVVVVAAMGVGAARCTKGSTAQVLRARFGFTGN